MRMIELGRGSIMVLLSMVACAENSANLQSRNQSVADSPPLTSSPTTANSEVIGLTSGDELCVIRRSSLYDSLSAPSWFKMTEAQADYKAEQLKENFLGKRLSIDGKVLGVKGPPYRVEVGACLVPDQIDNIGTRAEIVIEVVANKAQRDDAELFLSLSTDEPISVEGIIEQITLFPYFIVKIGSATLSRHSQ